MYRVDGADIYIDLPVALCEAALGASVQTPMSSGVVNLKIPPDSNQGRSAVGVRRVC